MGLWGCMPYTVYGIMVRHIYSCFDPGTSCVYPALPATDQKVTRVLFVLCFFAMMVCKLVKLSTVMVLE